MVLFIYYQDIWNNTWYPKAADHVNTEKQWYVVDATDKILGRLASTIAIFIRGKNMATYTPSVDMGAFVIVVCGLHTYAYFFLHDDSEEYALYNINLKIFKGLVFMVPGLGKTNLIFHIFTFSQLHIFLLNLLLISLSTP